VKADGEIISTIISSRGETVFCTVNKYALFQKRDEGILLSELTPGSRQSPSRLENRDDHCWRAEIFSQPFH
jgi:hypothetical protein